MPMCSVHRTHTLRSPVALLSFSITVAGGAVECP